MHQGFSLKTKFEQKYVIEKKISEGNFAAVFKAHQESNPTKKVAIKKLFSSRSNKKTREVVE